MNIGHSGKSEDSSNRDCKNCKYCDIWWGYTNNFACFQPECDWESGTLRDEDDLAIGYYFDPGWSEDVAVDCDYYEEEEG
ncbi:MULTISPECIES: hypothetical protein [unclassified Nodularia (in: cyanobacteria)]|uniref:hypothetical protein n=1 Tax=unclassified Nodularia (in: cyanobacteria) TaxID=2656917 RepID=UPI0018818FAD|nr:MULTISPECIES: hypothetical protein [unclassified Nodularia (in: cyanobacteria)]MBE9199072.1 hypothetical protein [Nodularia sp. LEGE 06071]MCC2694074.1 hypothetical protein [Nodularia sp. LEGE 04288]